MTPQNEIALNTLTRSLASSKMHGCALEVLGALTILNSLPMDSGVQTQKDTALELINRWLSFRRTSQQINSFLSKKCSCSSSLSGFEIHRIGASRRDVRGSTKPTPGELVLGYAAQMICNPQKELSGRARYQIHRLSSRDVWPYSTQQTLPHGPEETLRGYFDWLAADDTYVFSACDALQIFHVMADFAWPAVISIFKKTHLIPDRFVDMTKRWSKNIIAAPDRIETSMDRPYMEGVVGLLSQLAYFLRMLSSDCLDPHTARICLAPRRKEILGNCHRLLGMAALLSSEKPAARTQELFENTMKRALEVAVIIYNHFPEFRNNSVAQFVYHDTVIKHANPVGVPHILAWTILTDTLRYQYIRQTCAAPGCIRTTEDCGRSFRYCAGCHRVPYCSRACQKNAWRRDDGLGHWKICASLRSICIRRGLSHTSELRIHPPSVPEFSTTEVKDLYMINEHFQTLVTHALRANEIVH
jgi:hypothetical protein